MPSCRPAQLVGGSESYGNTAAAKEVAPQIAAHNPRDESEIRIKDARVSAASVSNGSGGSLQSGRKKPPHNRILLSTRPLHYFLSTNLLKQSRCPMFPSVVTKKGS